MARGFGTNFGSGSTDRLQVTNYTEINSLSALTYACFAYRNGGGGGGFGRLLDKGSDLTPPCGFHIYHNESLGVYTWNADRWDTTQGLWRTTAPSSGAWMHLAVTYGHSSTSEVPIVYYDGATQTVTTVDTPAGTLQSESRDFVIGNQAGATRNWDGMVAEVAIWNVQLTAAEIAALSKGISPLLIRPESLVGYWPCIGKYSPEIDPISGNGAVVTGALGVTHPRVFYPKIRTRFDHGVRSDKQITTDAAISIPVLAQIDVATAAIITVNVAGQIDVLTDASINPATNQVEVATDATVSMLVSIDVSTAAVIEHQHIVDVPTNASISANVATHLGDLGVDIYSTTGVYISSIIKVIRAQIVDKIDQVGTFQFVVAAFDSEADELTIGRQVKIIREGEGELWHGIISSREWTDDGLLLIKGLNISAELLYDNTLIGMALNNVSASVAVSTVLAGTGWTCTVPAGLSNITAQFDGLAKWSALLHIAATYNCHIRKTLGRTLELFNTPASTGIYLSNLEQTPINTPSNVGLISHIEKWSEDGPIVNYIVPLGAGEGNNRFSIRWSDRTTPYAVQTATGPDGLPYYFLRDTASESAYGTRKQTLVFKDVAPVANSPGGFTNASNSLHDLATQYLLRYAFPSYSGQVKVAWLPTYTWLVGDTMRLQFRGVVELADGRRTWLDIDTDIKVLTRTEDFGDDGVRVWSLGLATILRNGLSEEEEVVIGTLETLEAFKTAIKLYTMEISHGTERESIGSGSTYPFRYSVEYDSNVAMLLKCSLRVKLDGLKSNTTTAASGGGHTSGGGSSHSHGFAGGTSTGGGSSHTHVLSNTFTEGAIGTDGAGDGYTSNDVPDGFNHYHWYFGNGGEQHFHNFATSLTLGGEASHSHSVSGITTSAETSHTHNVQNHTHGLTYGIFLDSLPASPTVSVWINSTDRTAALGGPWNTGFKVDITPYLVDANGHPLRQENIVEIRNGSAKAYDVIVLASSMIVCSALKVA